MDPITLAIIIAGIASAVAVAKKRKPPEEALATNMAAREGAKAGAEVLEEAAPDATAAQQKATVQKAMKTAAKVALKALPIIAAVAAVVLIVKKVKAARQARSAALTAYWPILVQSQQADWLYKKVRARRTGGAWHRRVKISEKVSVASAMALVAKGDEAVKARVQENMKDPNWHETQPAANLRKFPWTTYPSYQAKQKAKELKLKREAATEAAKTTLAQAESVAGFAFL